MKFDKRIITHKWGNNPTNDEYTSSNGFVISGGSYGRSLAFYQSLAAEAKKDFPHLTDDQIECFVIVRSSYNNGFAGVRFQLPENTSKSGYSADSKLDFSHS